jgi:hypothetical protein
MGRQLNHSPAYTLEIKAKWRIVVPIRGKLTPRICPEEFATQEAARSWLQSDEGALAVDVLRSGTGCLQHPQHLTN